MEVGVQEGEGGWCRISPLARESSMTSRVRVGRRVSLLREENKQTPEKTV
jgi:hypothetical protein